MYICNVFTVYIFYLRLRIYDTFTWKKNKSPAPSHHSQTIILCNICNISLSFRCTFCEFRDRCWKCIRCSKAKWRERVGITTIHIDGDKWEKQWHRRPKNRITTTPNKTMQNGHLNGNVEEKKINKMKWNFVIKWTGTSTIWYVHTVSCVCMHVLPLRYWWQGTLKWC